jgi:hypothetical protein
MYSSQMITLVNRKESKMYAHNAKVWWVEIWKTPIQIFFSNLSIHTKFFKYTNIVPNLYTKELVFRNDVHIIASYAKICVGTHLQTIGCQEDILCYVATRFNNTIESSHHH